MTALHWLAYNNDHTAIEVLLRNGADHLTLTHDGLLPIDVAGTTPSLKCVDVLLEHYTIMNKLPKPKPFHHDYTTVDKFLDFDSSFVGYDK
jgi:ankyrin repeat protein